MLIQKQGAVIGGDFFNISSQNIADDSVVTFAIKDELAYYTGTSVVYYKAKQEKSNYAQGHR